MISNKSQCPKCGLSMSLVFRKTCEDDGGFFETQGIRTSVAVIPYSEYAVDGQDHFTCPECKTVLRPDFSYQEIGCRKYIPSLKGFQILNLRREFMRRYPEESIANSLERISEAFEEGIKSLESLQDVKE